MSIAESNTQMPQKGSKAPAFSLKDQAGNKVALKDLKGKKVALFFYPEDDTPTCTVEACNLRDNYALLKSKGIEVIGISPDDEQKHQHFISKFTLPFTLLSDPGMKVINLYGVWGEKNMYGRKYMGLKRTTFLIDENGTIHDVIARVLSKTHTAQILKAWNMQA
jgi:peroxiredoxin Q/BCP